MAQSSSTHDATVSFFCSTSRLLCHRKRHGRVPPSHRAPSWLRWLLWHHLQEYLRRTKIAHDVYLAAQGIHFTAQEGCRDACLDPGTRYSQGPACKCLRPVDVFFRKNLQRAARLHLPEPQMPSKNDTGVHCQPQLPAAVDRTTCLASTERALLFRNAESIIEDTIAQPPRPLRELWKNVAQPLRAFFQMAPCQQAVTGLSRFVHDLRQPEPTMASGEHCGQLSNRDRPRLSSKWTCLLASHSVALAVFWKAQGMLRASPERH